VWAGGGGIHDDNNTKKIEIYADKSRITMLDIVDSSVKIANSGTIRVGSFVSIDKKVEIKISDSGYRIAKISS
jgi:hypothetical protein